MARPKKKIEDLRKYRVNLRLTKKQYEELKNNADEYGFTVSELVVKVLQKDGFLSKTYGKIEL